MSKLIIIAEKRFASGVERGWDSTLVSTLDDAAELLEEGDWDAVLADFRDADWTVEQLSHLVTSGPSGALPTVLILPEGAAALGVAAKRRGMACLDERWLGAADGEVIGLCLTQMVRSFQQARELQSFKERQEQLLHAEKFAAVGLLAAEIAHEINNPATFVITNLTVMIDYVRTIGRFHSALRERLSDEGAVDQAGFDELERENEIRFLDEDLDSLLERSLAGLNRIHQIVQDLRYFSHDHRTESGWVDVGGLVRASVNLVRHEARFHTAVVVDVGELPAVESDANRLSQVILNVLVNAVQAIPPGSPTQNEVRVTSSMADGFLDLVVSDTGPGIDSEVIEKIFDPFFTTKESGIGTGLGLSIALDVMESLGGDLTVESEPGEGAKFTIRLPLHRESRE